ncbi:hsp70-interacting protein [Marchantia polymorpha subsp. ruderalis]|uniref:Nucleotide exchange factor Fes1 domain-containing protein n=2 Tax=Marchantia polymorpha TaxID=3197 RepID=A0A176W9N1_MARPO|nr:hypothetical protein AXG93_3884s1300 [Marchantia polymorpha subsp. ruderalis]PTQ30451.1 hypothetical protein MARPO_0124s0025 [Marchantia polymorpha]PTQ30452.1 hypothetical protein MARPO_0124s0025 [Marchantia polymorpha]BBN10365.1 hypothetical protein Mp_5g02980 [Marchantia polymorpha subsp. ruderalis]BBN10366.1 hypothetical protein Mp_5g02980 [Marchantia polymorpha subsp. ruderalis]|eukprot:PTQ30451.1 hypothetical protein MARPO_0124s0025 [Marchantia polymorpha]
MRNRLGMVEKLEARAKLVSILLVYVLCASNGVSGFSKLSDLGSSINMTSAGYAWVTAMDGDDLHSEGNVENDVYSVIGEEKVERDTEVEPAFTSIDSMLQWAIGHADPEKLKGSAQEVQRMTPQELEKRRAEIKELMEKLRVPSDADLMKIAIADLHNVTLPTEDRKRALEELLILVEPIDNANDLNKLGGLVAVIGELDREEAELRTAAASVLGKASQNNPIVQAQLLRQGVLPKLMKMVQSVYAEEAVKALYAVSAIIRNFPMGHEAFYLNGGVSLLKEVLSSDDGVDMRLQKKALFLVGDLAEQRIETLGQLDAFKLDEGLLKSVAMQTESDDMDTQEKALYALKSLHGVHSSVRHTLRKVCKVELLLERLKSYYEKLMSEPDQEQAEFIKDLEELRREVAELFGRKDDSETRKDESGTGGRSKVEEILYL